MSRHVPNHVTLRVAEGLPSLRGRQALRAVREALGRAKAAAGLRVVEYSIQANHLHLIVEADSARALARGTQRLTIRIARNLNRTLGRRGRVFADRYHSRALRTPREVHHALRYVLNNYRHADQRGPRLPMSFLDPCSSAIAFNGWAPEWVHHPPDPRAPRDAFPNLDLGTSPARSYLLRNAWRRHGLLSPFETPDAWQPRAHRIVSACTQRSSKPQCPPARSTRSGRNVAGGRRD